MQNWNSKAPNTASLVTTAIAIVMVRLSLVSLLGLKGGLSKLPVCNGLKKSTTVSRNRFTCSNNPMNISLGLPSCTGENKSKQITTLNVIWRSKVVTLYRTETHTVSAVSAKGRYSLKLFKSLLTLSYSSKQLVNKKLTEIHVKI